MATIERFLNKNHVLRRNWAVEVVDADGCFPLGRTHNVRARFEASRDNLTEIHADREEIVKSLTQNESLVVDFAIRELLCSTLQTIFQSDGRAPTIGTRTGLKRVVVIGQLLRDTDEYQHDDIYGIPQTHDSTVFPAPAAPSGTDSGAGTIADATYKLYTVPMYQDQDPKHGVAVTLANWAAKTRGRQYTLGTPSATSADVVVAGGSSAIVVTGIQPPSSGPRPSHLMIVVSTGAIGIGKVSAIVTYDTTGTTITALGATDFGATPAIADMHKVSTVSSSAGVRTFTSKTETTDYTFTPSDGTFKRVSGGGINDAAPVELVFWRIEDTTFVTDYGGSEVSEKKVWIRLRNIQPNGTAPASRKAYGATIDIPECNVAGIPREVLTSNETTWHDPLPMSLQAQFNSSIGYLARFRGESEDYQNLVDFVSNSITAANA